MNYILSTKTHFQNCTIPNQSTIVTRLPEHGDDIVGTLRIHDDGLGHTVELMALMERGANQNTYTSMGYFTTEGLSLIRTCEESSPRAKLQAFAPKFSSQTNPK